MIVDVYGKDMFAPETEGATRVIPINCKGVMGAGIAKRFKELYERDTRYIIDYCRSGSVRPGDIFQYGNEVIFFATKNHWSKPSKITWIKKGIPKLKEIEVASYMIIPPLGCGHGRLDWKVVYPVIREHLSDCSFDVLVYHPEGYVLFSTDDGISWVDNKTVDSR